MNLNFKKLADIAKANGQSQAAEKYEALISSMTRDSIKKYGILGDINSGKSTVVNALTGEKSAPVSLLSGKHDKILTVECRGKDYSLVELNSDTYLDDDVRIYDNPLWCIDAAVYIISALNPLTASDIKAINACISKGIPCTLVLNKFQMVDEDDKELTLRSVNNQLQSMFGSEGVIVFDAKNPEQSAEKILKELSGSEDSRSIREYAATVEFAKELEKYIGSKYNAAKKAYESMKAVENDSKLDELYWEELSMEIDRRRVRLSSDIDNAIFKMYSICNSNLYKRMCSSQSPDLWWKSRLRNDMENESKLISRRLQDMIENQIRDDKEWLSENVSKKFGLVIEIEDIDSGINSYEAAPQNISQRLENVEANKKKAISSLAVSAAVLAGGILLPLSAIPSIVACSIGGVAVVGTGFWTYVESHNAEEEKKSILRRELDRYVSQCRDSTLENLRGYIRYFYENMIISAKDAQMMKMSQDVAPTEEETQALAQLTRISSDKKTIDEILGEMILSDED